VISISKVSAIAIPFLMISCLTVMAQTQNMPISVNTDKPSYFEGNTIIISGNVLEQLNIPISVVIRDNSQHIVYLSQADPSSGNAYSLQATAGGDLWKTPGTYEIDVTYGGKDRIAKTTFEFLGNEQSNGTVNQANATNAIPEFGSLSTSIFVISILVVIIMYAKTRMSLKFKN